MTRPNEGQTINLQKYIDEKGVINNYDFAQFDNLTSIDIPDSVTSIGEAAFWRCNNLTDVTIGDGVTIIGDSAFEDCTSLTNCIIGNNVTKIGAYAFYGCSSLSSDLIIPDSVMNIGGRAFENCDSLKSVTIPVSVTSVGNDVFKGCKDLTMKYEGTREQWQELLKNSKFSGLQCFNVLFTNEHEQSVYKPSLSERISSAEAKKDAAVSDNRNRDSRNIENER